MSLGEFLLRIEHVHRELVLTGEEVKRFRDEFARLQERIERLLTEQYELRARVVTLELRMKDSDALRDRVSELEARFKSTLESALLIAARESISTHVRAYLDQNMSTLTAQSQSAPADGTHK